MRLDAFPNGGIQPRRYRPGGVGNWSGHLPFAYDLVAAVRPGVLVELGTHYGESYFGFCQAVAEKDIACACYAVDSWVGEVHAGYYDERVYQDVSAHNATYYSSFSYLVRDTFDNALANFKDESIDILHIDGLHTYSAVSHDLNAWLPKVKPGGIVLLHDVMARHADFGVWNAWSELTAQGEHFEFMHSWGLGVFRKPGDAVQSNDLFEKLFHAPPESQEHLRKFYALCASKLELDYERANRNAGPQGKFRIEVFPFTEAGYTADRVVSGYGEPDRWEKLSLELTAGAGAGTLRIDPAERSGVIDIAGLALRRLVDGETIWSARTYADLAALPVGGTLAKLERDEATDDKQEFCRYLSYGSDPQLFVPDLDWQRLDQPLALDIWVRMHSGVACLLPALQVKKPVIDPRVAELEAQAAEARSALVNLAAEHTDARETVRRLAERHELLVKERDTLVATCQKLQSDLYVCKCDLKGEKEANSRELQQTLAVTQQRLASVEATLHQALTSRSWRITVPLRAVTRLLKGS